MATDSDKKILIIDDEQDIREVLRLALRIDGYAADTAKDGIEGLEKFGDGGKYDLILLDQSMPGMDGLEVLRQMRERNPMAQVIMVTAYASVELAAEATARGAFDFIRKPFSGESLRGAVKVALEHQHQKPAAQEERRKAARNLNGFQFRPLALPEREKATPTLQICRAYEVETPSGDNYVTAVEVNRDVQELVRQICNRHRPPADSIWDTLCESALANYLWQEGEVPPETLRVRDLTQEQIQLVRGAETEQPLDAVAPPAAAAAS